MISLEDGIKYLALIAIIYFLIKAFVADRLGNTEIGLLVLFIMIPVIFICMRFSKKCKKRLMTEHYQITDPPVVPSIYPGPPNVDAVLGKVQIPPPLPPSAQNLDVQDFKSIVPIDLQVYEGLIGEEDAAKNRIRQSYANEMVFTETNPLNTVPLGTQLYGYTFLPPENWFRAYERPPVCITNNPNIVRPIGEGNYVADLLEFDTQSNIPGPAPVTPRSVQLNINKYRTPSPVTAQLNINRPPQPQYQPAQSSSPVTAKLNVGRSSQQTQYQSSSPVTAKLNVGRSSQQTQPTQSNQIVTQPITAQLNAGQVTTAMLQQSSQSIAQTP